MSGLTRYSALFDKLKANGGAFSRDSELPSWEGLGGGWLTRRRREVAAHPLPLPEGECAVDVSHRLRKS